MRLSYGVTKVHVITLKLGSTPSIRIFSNFEILQMIYYLVANFVHSIEPKNTRNCGQFAVCGTNLSSDDVAKPTGPRRRRNTCKREWCRYRNPLRSIRQLASRSFVTHERTDGCTHFWMHPDAPITHR
ncbi:hypothetical protein L596_021504 [Steinernema carpocapsae]|uniref:Uncharacterized protein n=1 Tax=Steinernema carpocapsae TaxID=34508 RepID=A0A4U5MIZ8_STECR|nr:hypothetical protein L596_021504 [Steinernema carpocapsae]